MNENFTLIFSQSEEQDIVRSCMDLFTKWMLKKTTFSIEYYCKNPWDYSTMLISDKLINEESIEIMNGTLGQWMDDHYRENSGYHLNCGFFYNSFYEYVSDRINTNLLSAIAEDEWEDLIENDDDFTFLY